MVLCLIVCLFLPCGAQAAPASTPPAAAAEKSAASENAAPSPPPEQQADADVVDSAWALAWENQPVYAAGMESLLDELRKGLPEMGRSISSRLPTLESNARALDLLAGQYPDNPQVLQAVHKRCLLLQRELGRIMAGAAQARGQLNELLPKISRFEEGLSGFQLPQDKARTQEVVALTKRVELMKKRLTEAQNRLAVITTPGDFLEKRLNASIDALRSSMAGRWLDYYTAAGRFFTPAAWDNISAKIDAQTESLKLRLPMELPQSKRTWQNVAPRFLNIFIFSTLFLFLLHAWLRRRGAGEEYRHMFTSSLPCICFGIACYSTAFGPQEELYRALLLPGNLALSWGQLALAWDLRRVNFPDPPRFSPIWGIFPLLLCGSLIISGDPPAPIQGLLWFAGLLLAVLIKRRRAVPDSLPQLEYCILKMEPAVLWLALFITLLGWARISILLYLIFVAVVVGINLATACITSLHKLSSRIPEEGAAGVIGGLLFSCAFPLVLALVLAGMLQCLVTCPGGLYLVLPYLRAGFSVGGVSVDIFLILLIFGAFYLTRALSSAGRAFIRKLPESGLDPTLTTPLQTGFTYSLWMLFALLILRAMGVSTDKLAIVAGGFSVGIGFGMQAIVNNLVSGLILIFSRTLREGDVVEVGNLTGTVRKISVRATTVETFDNAVIFVPNSEFISTRLINWTRNSRTVRREITVGVAYGTDHRLVQELLLRIASSNTRVLRYPKPACFFVGFGNSTLDFSLRFWVNDYNDGLSISSELRGEILSIFEEHKIEVAFPQLDVHVKTPQPAPRTPRPAPVTQRPRPRPVRRKAVGENRVA